MKLPSKTLERKLLTEYDYVVGVDEVGMGCLAGPVVVCAVALDKKFFQKRYPKLRGLRDSKLLSAKQREIYARELVKSGLRYQMVLCQPKTIDRINIYQAARLAMRRAIGKFIVDRKKKKLGTINYKLKTVILVDGKTKIPGLPLEQWPIVKGDRKVFAIACASILAKVYRDKLMIRYAKKFPGYGFEKHKGYGTKEHLEYLSVLGPCSLHRKSFAPVAKLI